MNDKAKQPSSKSRLFLAMAIAALLCVAAFAALQVQSADTALLDAMRTAQKARTALTVDLSELASEHIHLGDSEAQTIALLERNGFTVIQKIDKTLSPNYSQIFAEKKDLIWIK